MRLTVMQREVADLLLAGNDARTIARRLKISDDAMSARLADLRDALGVESHPECMSELRRLQRRPDESAIAECRRNPRTWCNV